MDVPVIALTLLALAALFAAFVSIAQNGRLMRERSERDGKLIDKLADKVCSNSELQLERIKIETAAVEAAAKAARDYSDALSRNNGFYPPAAEEESVEVPSRT